MDRNTGFRALLIRSVLQLVRRPVYWCAFFLLPVFIFVMLSSLMEEGLPAKIPAAIVDNDHSPMSRNITQTLAGMQMVDIAVASESYTQARHKMQEGEIFGYFMIPSGFQEDLMAGKAPTITFYTNMTYFVPASLLYKTFKTTALYTKAGIMLKVLESAGADAEQVTPMLQPVNIIPRPLGNPELNYAIYLCNSFIPCVLQLMIMLVTCFSIGEEVKRDTSRRWLDMAHGSVLKALIAKLLPQTIIWMVVAFFMTSWLFKWNEYPMNGSWGWMALSEALFVLACQGFGLFIYGVFPNLRLSLSVSSLLGILSFSIAAFSFPVEAMYPAVGIFSWIVPIRYNFLIYIDQALNGIDIYYSRIWYVAYLIFILLPLPLLPRIKKDLKSMVYAP